MSVAEARPVDVHTSTLIRALERAWKAIQARHPELPDTVILIGPGRLGQREIWGWFAASRWVTRGGRRFHEILIAGESFKRPAAETIGTLLHEAAHCLAAVRREAAPEAERAKLKDTSRDGRYHNARYKALAEELGLIVNKHKTIGWSLTEVPEATAAIYKAEIAAVDVAQGALYRSEILISKDKKRQSRITLRCKCRSICLTPGAAKQGPIRCMACMETFKESEEDDDDES